MRYEILGPMRIVDGDRSFHISARKIETLLIALLIRSNHVVAASDLITEIWGERVPRRATAGLHVYISELRKFLSRCDENPIITRQPGYVFNLGDDTVDFHELIELTDRGRAYSRAHDHEAASQCLGRALRLWRGPVPNAATPGPILDGFMTWLTETRLECLDMLMEAQLHLGRHGELVGRLYSLTTEHPLREGFYRQLMLALYRSDRKADALRVYQTARQALHEELGLEPCRALQELELRILTADRQLDFAVAA